MITHTPGPWRVVTELRDDDEIVCDMLNSGWVIKPVSAKLAPWQNDACLIASAPDLLKALEWALPLARLAMEAHRMERLRCGHNDIVGKYKSGQTWSGIYQSEVDEIEFAGSVLAKAKGMKP